MAFIESFVSLTYQILELSDCIIVMSINNHLVISCFTNYQMLCRTGAVTTFVSRCFHNNDNINNKTHN